MQLRVLGFTPASPSHPRIAQLRLRVPSPAHAGPAEGARFWRALGRKAGDVVCGELSVAEVPFHAHEAVQVLLPTSPLEVIGGARRGNVLYPGIVHVTGPLELRALRSLDGAPFGARVLLVSPAVLTPRSAPGSLASRVPGTRGPDAAVPRFAELVVDDRALYDELMSLFDALRRPLVEVHVESRLVECLARLVARHADSAPIGGGKPPAGVVRARDYLCARAAENVTLDELATAAGLSKFYMLRAFYRAYGLTPHAYHMQLRLARARRLLAEGRPLSHVTYDAGFADQSHLTRRFAAFYGLTPARYARQLRTPPVAAIDVRPAICTAATPPSAA